MFSRTMLRLYLLDNHASNKMRIESLREDDFRRFSCYLGCCDIGSYAVSFCVNANSTGLEDEEYH